MAYCTRRRNGGDVALAENSEFRLCREHRPCPRPNGVGSRLAQHRAGRSRAAPRLARRAVVAAGHAGAGPTGAVGAGGNDVFKLPEVDARHDAVFAALRAARWSRTEAREHVKCRQAASANQARRGRASRAVRPAPPRPGTPPRPNTPRTSPHAQDTNHAKRAGKHAAQAKPARQARQEGSVRVAGLKKR